MRARILWIGFWLGVTACLGAEDRTVLRERLAENPYDLARLEAFARTVASEPDRNLRAHDLSICYLGYLARGEGEIAGKAYQELKTAHPDSNYVERLSPTRFTKVCPDCRRPRVQNSVVCPTCTGTNLCPVCKGKKSIQGLSNKPRPCITCGGTGRCTKCGRDGRIQVVCATCGGSARVPDRERMMLVIKRLLQSDLQAVKEGKWVRVWGPDPETPPAAP